MKKSFITITVLFLILLLNGCSKEPEKNSEIFYGESDKWIVIGTIENTFKFSYKGNVDDLMKSNPEKKITFSYGTFQGSTVATETLTSATFYEVAFINNFIKDAESDSNNLVNVQISYGKTSDSIELQEYFTNIDE